MHRTALILSAITSMSAAQSASTVYVVPVPASSTSPSASASAAPTCPESDGRLYTAPSGDQYAIECNVDHYAGDLRYVQVESFEECILECDQEEDCVDVSLSGVACYMKSTVGTAITKNGIWGARLIVSASSVSAPSPTPPVPTASCPADNGTTYISSSYSRYTIECGFEHAAGDMAMSYVDDFTACIELCDSTEGCVDVSLSGTACYLKSFVGPITYTEGISSARKTAMGPTCPGSNGTVYEAANGLEFVIECDVDHPGGDLQGVVLGGDSGEGWFGECIELCSQNSSCIDISLSGAGCYLKDTLYPSSPALGIYGARLLNPPTPSPSPSTTPTPVPSAISPIDVGPFEYVACYNDSVARRVLNSGFLYGSGNNSMTAEKCADFCEEYTFFGLEYGQECYCGGTLLNGPVEVPGKCGMVCAGNETQICGGDGALSLYRKLGSVEPSPPEASSSSAVENATSSASVTEPTVVVTSSTTTSYESGPEATSSYVSSFMPSLTTASYPTSTGSVNVTDGNSTDYNTTYARIRRRRQPRLGPVRLDLNYAV